MPHILWFSPVTKFGRKLLQHNLTVSEIIKQKSQQCCNASIVQLAKGGCALIDHYWTCREFMNMSALPLCLSFLSINTHKRCCVRRRCVLLVDLEGRPLSTSCDSIGTMDSSSGLQCFDGLDVYASTRLCTTITQTTQRIEILKNTAMC